MTQEDTQTATIAGGCFWCMEPPFANTEGVVSVMPGYSGGEEEDPSYEQVALGKTSHREAAQIIFDPKKVSYQDLLKIFWENIDPTDKGGQFADRGHQYQTAIFYHNEEQKEEAEKSKKELENSGKFDQSIATEILPFISFYPAEEKHQQFYLKNPTHYELYKEGSGRGEYIRNQKNTS